jgi:hypothetical protein
MNDTRTFIYLCMNNAIIGRLLSATVSSCDSSYGPDVGCSSQLIPFLCFLFMFLVFFLYSTSSIYRRSNLILLTQKVFVTLPFYLIGCTISQTNDQESRVNESSCGGEGDQWDVPVYVDPSFTNMNAPFHVELLILDDKIEDIHL